MEFFLGDLRDELIKRSGLVVIDKELVLLSQPSLLSRREHVFGHKSTYMSRAQFLGSKHEIGVECNGGILKVKVDGKTSLVIKRLAWKFRGHERIYIGGIEVEFFWDVFNWVNNNNSNETFTDQHHHLKGGNQVDVHHHGNGHGVFIFQVGDGGVWPEMIGPEKRLMKKSLSSVGSMSTVSLPSSSPSCSSVLQWAEESSDCGRSSCSSAKSCGSNGGFSLLLYAWRKD